MKQQKILKLHHEKIKNIITINDFKHENKIKVIKLFLKLNYIRKRNFNNEYTMNNKLIAKK
jgi:hypothetical protein